MCKSANVGGSISLAAENNLTARVANIASGQGDISLSAGRDIRLTAGKETAVDRFGEKHKASAFLSTMTTTLRSDSERTAARGTNVTGKNVHLAAQQDIQLQAANVVADESAAIAAGRNLSAETAENYAHTDSLRETKTSGVFSSGGLGFTIGTQKQKSERESSALTQAGTNIAGLKGDVRITAGETAHLTSADILAGKEASIQAKETHLDGKENIYRESFTQESRTTGLTVSLSHGLLDLGQEIAAPLMRMGEVKDDRLKAGRLIHENFGKGQNPLKNASGFSLNLSLGTSKTYSRTESTSKEYVGSTIRAGGTTSIEAAEHDLSVKGSQVAGKDVSLKAKGDVRLEAGENTSVTTSENKTSAASIGASFSPQGLSGLSLSASSAKGKSKESRTSYTPTEVKAAGTLKLESGKDTNILGSKAKGEKIEAKVGGNLTIETLQEKETYEEKNTSAGFNLSWSMNQMLDPAGSGKILRSFSKPTIGASVSKGSLESYYRSAREQAGIFAGKDGFDIYVEKNTGLKGGVLASDAEAEKNRLSTGTFSFSDLENEADYSAKSIGAAYHHYGSYDKMSQQAKDREALIK
ncbi:hemagglutinin repeat-containing protein [Selenomonas sputigena]|uniref:Hemagglutinin repeat-containing protein n=1 Tax=Selenomonas sputigena TaxID=69823 RepID=A0ABV3X1N0_9FIRM